MGTLNVNSTCKCLVFLGCAALAVLLLAGGLSAQKAGTDAVQLTAGGQPVTGAVIKESWRGVEIDTDGDGQANATYPLSQVVKVNYGNDHYPLYLSKAKLLAHAKGKEQEYLDEMQEAYRDRETSPWVLQHAYYDIAQKYMEMAQKEDKYLPLALQAYDKLLTDIPETRYAPEVRLNEANMFFQRGELDEAHKRLAPLYGKGFDPAIEARGLMLDVQILLLGDKPDQAETVLGKVSPTLADAHLKSIMIVLRAEVQIAKKQFDPAYQALVKVVADKTDDSVKAEACAALGDLLRLNARPEDALLAYLRAKLMYKDVDPFTQARILVGAIECCDKLERQDKAREFREEIRTQFPNSVWLKKVKQP
jgi:predicted negative regulator of RcsB-dependent stress response